MKEKISSFTHTEIFNVYIIYIQVVLKRIHKHVPTNEICTYYSMNQQYVKGVQNRKRLTRLMDSRKVIAMLALLFNDKATDISILFKEQRQKEWKWFSWIFMW